MTKATVLSALKEGLWRTFVSLFAFSAVVLVSEVVLHRLDPPPRGLSLDWSVVGVPDQQTSLAVSYFDWADDFFESRARDSAYRNQLPEELGYGYSPYRLWKNGKELEPNSPLLGQPSPIAPSFKYRNWDVFGFRLTHNPERNPGWDGRPAKVFMLGGSTLAGAGVIPDKLTIPSLLSKKLNAGFPDRAFEVYNLGQGGYTFWNQVILLLKLLSLGYKPDIVVFYAGGIDTLHQVCWGQPHGSYQSFREVVRAQTTSTAVRGLKGLARHSRLIRYMLPRRYRDVPSPYGLPETRDDAVLNRRIERLILSFTSGLNLLREVSAAYGFRFYVCWEPNLFVTGKPLSSEEAIILQKIRQRVPLLGHAHRLTYAVVSRELFSDDRLFDFSDALNQVEESVFLDFSHFTPLGSEAIAQRMFVAMQSGEWPIGPLPPRVRIPDEHDH